MALALLQARLPPPLGTVCLATRTSAPPSLPRQVPAVPLQGPAIAVHAAPSISPSGSALQCQHFESCSGCTHEWNLDRPPVVEEVAEFFKVQGVSDFTFESGRLYGWRCRAKLAVRGTPENPMIGLYQEGTHNVVNIPLCRAHHPSINAAIILLKQGISALNILPYNEDEGSGELRYVQMAVTTHRTSLPFEERYIKGKVQVTLVWNSRSEKSSSSEKLSSLSNFLWRNGGPKSTTHIIHSVWANFQTSANNIIFGNRWRHLLGEADFWERLGGVDVSLAPSSFGQANTEAFDCLLRKLQKNVPYGSTVVDLYAGAGVIGLSLAVTRKCRSVKCVEINRESKLSFEKSVSRLPKTIDSDISWHHADASIDSFHWLKGSEVIVVDPPRKGLDSSLLEALKNIPSSTDRSTNLNQSSPKVENEKRPWILRSREASVQVESKTNWDRSQTWPQTLIYISCGWQSFKEDCRSLLSKKWRLEKAHAFNFFPGTQSIEVLAIFKRGSKGSCKKKKSGKKKKRNASELRGSRITEVQ